MPGSPTVRSRAGESRNIRVSGSTHAKIGDLATKLGTPMQEVLDLAVETLRRKLILETTKQGYAHLQREEPEAWTAFCAEMEVWDQTGEESRT